MSESTLDEIKAQIAASPALLYMKGTPEHPLCGFSARAVQVLLACGISFESINILERDDIRSELPKYAEWPTFPQFWFKGQLIGGSDILLAMYESGELQDLLEQDSKNSAEDPEQGS